MGLDIQLSVNNADEVLTPDYYENKEIDSFYKHNLSRTFCNFMCKQDAVSGEPELDQIGRITSVDIVPLYDMNKYWVPESIEHQLSFAETEEEKQQIFERINTDRARLETNLEIVLSTVSTLIEKISNIQNLPELLNDNGFDSLNNNYYFSDFNIDKGDGYIGNNFGQDLRNFKRFLEYVKSKGSTGVYFIYG
ncbi:hypothetical protein [Flavisolibacter tropicus]|uniref:Uncharacterized protein n=1 Tax=Flavisolibacter tropicus TaxID=1492898 RepID=A0A172TVK6_9BACT|nr:hypothetical protein [Flavisolibacter tropicus]ANE51070.1 hypothetical protein SY85_11720 [Flavisolibacter tropicus]